MTDSMNFGPEWLRNLSSEGSITPGSTGGVKYQLAEYRYGREEMLALFEKGSSAPSSLASFTTLYSEQQLTPLALLPQTEEERSWQSRPVPPGGPSRGRGISLERGRLSRGRGSYQSYSRSGYEGSGSWGNGEHSDWSPRKDYSRTSSLDNWRRNRGGDEEDGWRSSRGANPETYFSQKGRSASWRESDNCDERGGGGPDRGNRSSWHESSRGPLQRRQWDTEDHLPEWAMENPSESGGSFDASGAFHGSDDEQRDQNYQRPSKKEPPLQKSSSAQNILDKQPSASSKSLPVTAVSTSKQIDKELPEKHKEMEGNRNHDKEKEIVDIVDENIKNKHSNNNVITPSENERDSSKTEEVNLEVREKSPQRITTKLEENSHPVNRVDEDFDRLQEDLVQKLVVEEDIPKKQSIDNFGLGSSSNVTHPPPNLGPPSQVQNSWYYQDPQGDLQGPFSSTEMAEWYKAGYFSTSLLVKRQCDEGFYRLGDLVSLCGGNPFLTPKPIPPLKQDVSMNVTKQFEMLQRQLALSQATAMRSLSQNEFWSNLNALQQRELIAQHMLTQPQISPELQFLQQTTPNPLMHMINQMQQANKLPGQSVADKTPTSLGPQLDPIHSLMQQVGSLPTIPNTLQTGVGSLPTSNGLPPSLQAPALSATFPTLTPLAMSGLPVGGLSTSLPGMPTVLTNNSAMHNTLPPRPNPLGAVDPLSTSSSESDPIKSLLRQLQSKPPATQQMDSLWQSNQQFNNSQSKPQWQQQNESPVSVWDIQTPSATMPSVPSSSVPNSASLNMHPIPTSTANPVEPSDKKQQQQQEQQQHQEQKQNHQKSKEEEKAKKAKEEKEKELTKARELEEQQKKAKKDAEEKKRKEELKKQEAEKKAAEEKRKKEEERMKKELEKAKKEAEEKRLRELEEKRRLKEQRKAEEEARRKAEEKKKEEEERARREAKEKEEVARKQQEEKTKHDNSIKLSRAAPWSQTNPVLGASLAEIQKLEKEKKQEQQLLKQQQLLQEQQQTATEKTSSSSMPLSWAKKPPEPKKIKSLAEIQMEEQERLARQAAEARLAQMKEKDGNPTVFMNTTPWSGQSLSWANTASHWNTGSGFWEETLTQRSQNKPSIKSSATTPNLHQQQPQTKQSINKQNKSKVKKEEQQVMKLFNSSSNNKQDEFMEWCTKTLSKLEASVDIETFIDFLRNVESALEVRDYCREYLGDSPSTSHFATQFLEKRRLIKPKVSAQKDDMSSPAPAITPSSHPSDFQEVKGKGKKTKKSKMTKLDKSILGFSVTSAPDRINIGDRDYVEN